MEKQPFSYPDRVVKPLGFTDNSVSVDKWNLVKIAVQIVLGQFTFSIYPFPVVIGSITVIAGLFFLSLYRGDYFFFLMQLFICNHFMFGYENGGVYNMAATVVLLGYLGFYNNRFLPVSVMSKTTISIIVALVIIQMISVLNNGNAFGIKISAVLIFCNLMFLFFYSSKIKISEDNFYSFLKITGVFFIYSFCIALNQKYSFFYSPFAFFPSLDPNAEYEYGILRSVGTLGNFEYYAEYSVSIIALLLPGILSNSASEKKITFLYFCCTIVFVGALSIFLSGTRSSILLLPLVVLMVCLFLGKRLKIRIIIRASIAISVFMIINSGLHLIDFDVFSKRSQGVDMKKLTIAKIISGEDMNRGPIFAYGINKALNSSLFYGEGYFTNRAEYVRVHFDNMGTDVIPDYHNLYMSAIVIWGYLGAILVLGLFLETIIRGFRLYFRLRHLNHFMVDLLLGFNILFSIFLINQFKIEFIRDANYFLLILILLSFYNSLIYLLKENSVIIKRIPDTTFTSPQ